LDHLGWAARAGLGSLFIVFSSPSVDWELTRAVTPPAMHLLDAPAPRPHIWELAMEKALTWGATMSPFCHKLTGSGF